MASYSSAFNTNTLQGVDIIEVSEIDVASVLNQTGATWYMDQIDNTTIQFTNNKLSIILNSIDGNYIKDGSVSSIKLAPQTYIPFVDSSSPNQVVNLTINETGLENSKFITQDSVNPQYINNDLYLDSSFILSSYLANSVIYLNASNVLETIQLNNAQFLIGLTSNAPLAGTIISSTLSISYSQPNIVIEYNQPSSFPTITLDNYTSPDGSDELVISNGPLNSTKSNKRFSFQLYGDEGGANTGSNLQLIAYDDTGAQLGSAYLSILRDNGAVYVPTLNIYGTNTQIRFGTANPPTSYVCTFNINLSSSTNTFLNFRDSGGNDYVVYENLTQTLNNKTFIGTIQLYPGTGTAPVPTYITAGNAQVSIPQLILQGYLDNTQQLQIQYDTVNNLGVINAENSGGVIPIILAQNGADVKTGKDFYCEGNIYATNNIYTTLSAIFGNMSISYNLTSNYGIINAGLNPLFINNGGGITSFNNTYGILTYVGNTNGVVYIFGTFGSTDASSDVLHIREDTDLANPREVYIGYNANNDYGVIQAQKVGRTTMPLSLNPLGSQVIVPSAGIQFGNPGSILSPFIEFLTTVFLYFNGVAAVQINIAVYQINHKCSIMTSAVNLTGVNYTTPIYFSGIPGYTPNYNWYSGSGPSINGTIYVNGTYYQTRNVYDSSGGSNRFYIEPVNYSASSITSFIMDGWTLEYYI